MRRFALVFAALVALAACDQNQSSSGSSVSGEDGVTCSVSADCPEYDCTCVDGSTVPKQQGCTSGSCATGAAACATACQSNGGLAQANERVNLIGSPECNAVCQKIDALSCSKAMGGPSMNTCAAGQNCSVNDVNGTCGEAVREWLVCVAQMGSFACNGDTLVVSAGPCGPNSSVCQ